MDSGTSFQLLETNKQLKRIADILEHNVIPERTWLAQIAKENCDCHLRMIKEVSLWDARLHETDCRYRYMTEKI